MSRPPNIVLITSDQQLYRSLGVTGSAVAKTPNLDRLASQGLLFRKHFVTNPVCSPSRGSFMTGLYPCESGLWDNGCALPQDRPTLASALGAGYQTAHVGKLHLVPILPRVGPHPAYGFDHIEVGEGDQMYPCDDHMNYVRQADPIGYVEIMTEAYEQGHGKAFTSKVPEAFHHSTWTTDRAIDWLDNSRTSDKPFFLNVGYFDPHHAFNPIEPWASMFDDAELELPEHDPAAIDKRPRHYRGPYEGAQKNFRTPGRLEGITKAFHAMMAHLDHCLGRLLATLDDIENTVVVFSSDHGEFLGNHGMLHKGPYMLDSLMHVPAIVRTPSGRTGTVDGLTSMIDLMRTFTHLAAVENPSPHGLPMVDRDGTPTPEGTHEAVFAQWERGDNVPESSQRMIRTEHHKLIKYADENIGEFYDYEDDPTEQANLYYDPTHAELRAELTERLAPQLAMTRPDVPNTPGW